MKQKKKAVRSDVMDLVLMGVKKAFDKRVKDSKERRKEEKRKDRASRQAKRKLSIEKIIKLMFEYFRAIPKHIIT
ncbi:hypothetical protein AGMMS49921_00820 [Endomicrobiia bacterium]|nr:hypothetical protein AGMMS49921_00820 [Endomicrobiia bacterium]